MQLFLVMGLLLLFMMDVGGASAPLPLSGALSKFCSNVNAQKGKKKK